MQTGSPFLEVRSFEMDAFPATEALAAPLAPAASPFLSLYEYEGGAGRVDPRAEEYALFLNELYDEEFEHALAALAGEASALHEARVAEESGNQRSAYEDERILEQHFAPLLAESQAMLGALAAELGRRDVATLTQDEIDAAVDRMQPSGELAPSFEEFFSKLKKAVKKVAGKAVALAKKGVSLATKLGLGPVLDKLKGLIKPLLKRVIQTAIGKLPPALQPAAKKLAEKLPFLKEAEEAGAPPAGLAAEREFAEMQLEFDRQVANLLFAHDATELELEFAEALAAPQGGEAYPVMELDHAREQFIDRIAQLRDGEDPAPHVQQFVPAILPALKIGISIVGRKRVVDFLAGLLAKAIQKFVGPQFAMPLSQAIVDAGLRLIQLEADAEDEARAAASAVAATVEETVRRVAALPDYVLDNQELLEGFALEAFEQAAASNLPPVLPEQTYRKRPELAEGKRLGGAWMLMPRGRHKRYKKFSRPVRVRITPHGVSQVESFEGVRLSEFLEEQLGVAPGEELDAIVHLYETIPGTRLPDVARLEAHIPGLGSAEAQAQLHPLTREAAAALLGEAQLGREQSADPHAGGEGRRLYYLEVPGHKPLAVPDAKGRPSPRRPSQLRLVLDFPKNEIRAYLFLSEVRAQGIAVKLRQHGHVGAAVAHLGEFVLRGLRSALRGAPGRVKIIHEALTPDQWTSALGRLPSFVTSLLLGRLQEWLLKAVSAQLKKDAAPFIKAAEDTADGVTLVLTLSNPPGFAQIRKALKGAGLSLGGLRLPGGEPAVAIRFAAGYARD